LVDHISEIILDDAVMMDKSSIVGGVIYKPADPVKIFDRVMINQFKKLFSEYILMYQRDQEYNKFIIKQGTVAYGLVKSIKDDNIIISIEGVNTLLPRKENLLKQKVRIGDMMYVYIKEVMPTYRADLYQIIVSRKGTELIQKLLENVIPEIINNQIGVHKIVRIPGYKSKISLQKLVDTINPVSVAIGYNRNRLNTLNKQLPNEIIEFFEYTPDVKDLITTMLKKIKISPIGINLNYEKKTVTVILNDSDIYNAIGTSGREVTMMRQFLPEDFDRLILVKKSDSIQGITGPEYYFGDVLNLDHNVTNFLESLGVNSINQILKRNKDNYIKLLTDNDMDTALAQMIYDRAKMYTNDRLVDFKELGGEEELFMFYNLEPDACVSLAENNILNLQDLSNADEDKLKEILRYYCHERDIVDLFFNK
jgi:N utilization substance protein A